MYFYLSIGTNLDPQRNAVRIVEALAEHFAPLILHPFCHTAPVKLDSKHPFLNALATIKSELSHTQLKHVLTGIESSLGRDRSDPERSVKDRPADLDILGSSAEPCLDFFQSSDEPYIQQVLRGSPAADLRAFGLPASEGAATIDFDRCTGHVVVVENGLHRLEDWQKSALGL